ncbi:MAG: hypothetical protein R3E39_10790 [Anaerolineae bacterium]
MKLLLVLLGLFLSVMAQPDPDAIFSDRVEVVSMQVREVQLPPPVPTSILSTLTADSTLTYNTLPAPLPDGYAWTIPIPPIVSPDDRYIVLFGDIYRKSPHILIFNVETATYHDLGSAKGSLYKAEWEWYDDTTLIMYGQDFRQGSLYTAYAVIIDITHGNVNSLGPSTFPYNLLRRDDPPQIQAFMRWDSIPPLCRWEVFDLNRRIPLTYDYRELCDLEYGEWLGDGYFRVLSEDGKTATVIHYTPQTQRREELYSGEVEHILWVQQGYAALMVSDLGRVYVKPGEFLDVTGISTSLALNIVDLATKRVLYTTPAQWYGPKSTIWTPSAYFVSEDWLQIDRRYYADPNQNGAAHNSLVNVKTGTVREIAGQIDRKSLGNGWSILLPAGNFEYLTQLNLYNLTTQETVPVANIKDLQDASIGLIALANNLFQITLRQNSPNQPPREMVFVVRIAGVMLQ